MFFCYRLIAANKINQNELKIKSQQKERHQSRVRSQWQWLCVPHLNSQMNYENALHSSQNPQTERGKILFSLFFGGNIIAINYMGTQTQEKKSKKKITHQFLRQHQSPLESFTSAAKQNWVKFHHYYQMISWERKREIFHAYLNGTTTI